jgi:hypothetical protein
MKAIPQNKICTSIILCDGRYKIQGDPSHTHLLTKNFILTTLLAIAWP